METDPTPKPTVDAPAILELQRSVGRLQTLLSWTLAALILLSGSLFIFLLREIGIVRRQNADMRQVVADFERETAPRLKEFERNLNAYAEKDPQFRQLLNRYFRASSTRKAAGGATDASQLTNLPPPNL